MNAKSSVYQDFLKTLKIMRDRMIPGHDQSLIVILGKHGQSIADVPLRPNQPTLRHDTTDAELEEIAKAAAQTVADGRALEAQQKKSKRKRKGKRK